MRIHWIAGAAALLASAASAGSEWQTVTLDGGLTMDVPAVMGSQYKTTAEDVQKGGPAFFDLSTKDWGELYCLVSRDKYATQITLASVTARLAGNDRSVLCTNGDGRTDIEVGESQSLVSNGRPAGYCDASYTKANDKQPGRVLSLFTIAVAKAVYQLSCTVVADSKLNAETHWAMYWSDSVKHMKQSIRLPQNEK